MTQDPGWSTFSGVLTTTHAIEAYGGFQFRREELEAAAEGINRSGLALTQNHDSTQRVRTRNIRVEVRARDDGEYELFGTGEVHEEDAHLVELGGGLSVTITRPLPGHPAERTDVGISVAANAAWFPDDAIEAAQAVFAQVVPAEGVRLYEFGHDADAHIIVTVTRYAWTLLGGEVVWDGLKLLWAARRLLPGRESMPTRITLDLQDGDKSAVAGVETTDQAVAGQALESFDRAIDLLFGSPSDAPAMLWNEVEERWDEISE
jgi:hypothetical protein